MPDQKLICTACGMSFTWKLSEQDQQKVDIAPGDHHPKDCPEGLDQFCPKCAQYVYDVPTECPSCREKQDGQRS